MNTLYGKFKVRTYKLLGLSLMLLALPVNAQETQSIEDVEDIQVVEQATPEAKPTLFDRQLIADLDASQQRLLLALQEEDAFSLKLAESYGEYGALLSKAYRLDEAREVYTDALHIQKVNHGIYSQEQLFYIKELFEIAIKTKDEELIDRYLNRANVIEEKNKGLNSEDIEKMYLSAGHFNLDRYYRLKRKSTAKLQLLISARNFFDQVLLRKKARGDEGPRPYGELLLISYLENSVIEDIPISKISSTAKINSNFLSPTEAFQLQQNYQYAKQAYSRGTRYFNSYIRHARKTENSQDAVNALLDWADTLILFNRSQEAAHYYKLAWQEALDSSPDQQLLSSASEPKLLPDYQYLIERQEDKNDKEEIVVPLSFTVSNKGSVSNVEPLDLSEEQKKYFNKARREVLKLSFRPVIVDGNLEPTERFTYEVKLAVK